MRCIAIGRGRETNPHFYFYDIDSKVSSFMQSTGFGPMIYETKNGYHVLSARAMPELDKFTDDNCPGSAVRFYPHTDYKLVASPKQLCRQVFHLYASFFPELGKDGVELLPCTEPLKFGVYSRPKPL